MKVKFIILFIFLYSIFFYLTTQSRTDRINTELNQQIKDMSIHYAVTKSYFLIDAISIRANLLSNQKVISLFSQAASVTKEKQDKIRKELYKMLLPMYNRLKKRGILQVHFVFKDNISFLRMHKYSKYGDDLSDIRYSFKYVNKTKETVEGFEQGRTTHAFRYVFPTFDKDKNHIGALEVSLASYALKDKLKAVNKIHSHFLVDKNIFKSKMWGSKNSIQEYIQSFEHKDYMFAVDKNTNMKNYLTSKHNVMDPLREQIDSNVALRKPFALYVPFNDTIKVTTYLPIRNIKDKKVVAYLVTYTNNSNIHNIIKYTTIYNIVIFFGLLFLMYFICRTLNNKIELELEVKVKTQDLNNSNNNLEKRITEEIEKNEKIQNQLFKSEKMASMGEMIGNIAHQWRQPLSVISTASSGMLVQKEFDILSDEEFTKNCEAINRNAQYLSKTIDDFKNFIKKESVKEKYSLEDTINSTLQIIEGTLKNNEIKVILELEDDINIIGYGNELTQCLINIFNNAKDVLVDINSEDRFIFIKTKLENDKAIICIQDTAGGIPEDILPKIFEPYFTTKHQSQGTGLGLHMTYNLIVDGMGGNIVAKNSNIDYNSKQYTGAKFLITLPLS